jgi:3'-phosphoadenosine 5'-phosphosulfate sulfotransferase (PAPS reductase)/FAD synthetase
MLWTGENNSAATVNESGTVFDAMEGFPHNMTVVDNFVRAWTIINRPYKKVLATISGGSDSDVVLDICSKADKEKKIKYVWINTGLEYQATKDHLAFLEKKYGITITKIRPKMPVPLAVKKFGQPFLNKRASEYIARLQKHGFNWVDGKYEDLIRLYPKCKSAIAWWCNMYDNKRLNIDNNKMLKEFMIENPPAFKISSKCCYHAKKSVIHNIINTNKVDLSVFGVRKAEGGTRSTAYKSCFGSKDAPYGEYDEYRPVWWYLNGDKEEYCKACDVTHSRCYTEYGLARTGCCGCPFGRDFRHELEVAKEFEPKLYSAVTSLFKDSYAYMKAYHEFVKARS